MKKSAQMFGFAAIAAVLAFKLSAGVPISSNSPPTVLYPKPLVKVLTNGLPVILPPGLYETDPYKMLVLSPGPQADEKMSKTPGDSPRMPVITPNLRFTPKTVGPAKPQLNLKAPTSPVFPAPAR